MISSGVKLTFTESRLFNEKVDSPIRELGVENELQFIGAKDVTSLLFSMTFLKSRTNNKITPSRWKGTRSTLAAD